MRVLHCVAPRGSVCVVATTIRFTLAREIDAGFTVEQMPAELAEVRARIVETLAQHRLEARFIQIEVRQSERSIFERRRDNHWDIGRFGWRNRIERMMGQNVAVHHRREPGDTRLRFKELLPRDFLNIGNSRLWYFQFRKQLLGKLCRGLARSKAQRRTALHRSSIKQTFG